MATVEQLLKAFQDTYPELADHSQEDVGKAASGPIKSLLDSGRTLEDWDEADVMGVVDATADALESPEKRFLRRMNTRKPKDPDTIGAMNDAWLKEQGYR